MTEPADHDANVLGIRVDPDASIDELRERCAELIHEQLRLRDQISGLTAERDELARRMEAAADVDHWSLITRIDELEVRLRQANHLLADEKAQRNRERDEVKASNSWRIGNAIVRPVSAITGRGRGRA
ncbi:hypothetical protein [Agromyces seonyuensis]|uniref:Uncharacterized protein n=1 Tax=Agromyces seonyuensis TaxID=2662446 RepID=A0A6I4P6I2_9MICO|nr:hypothetical protein [Agromyces seonyuensis]MWB99237.1 hypothetical protein [Agromyces seonyuensis]